MDDNFFKQLDEALTNVGADKHFERVVGNHAVWLSPVPYKSQRRINETLTNQELGSNVIGEVKRMTLSYAIVGFDGFDLRQYRNDTPLFPVMDPREKKVLKVPLHKYLSSKMEEWGTEWIDSAFDVFADIMESVKKDNLKEVKFDNVRNKQEELAELEEKVRDLREELKLPPLVELDVNKSEPGPPEDKVIEPEPEFKALFNPFQKIEQQPLVEHLDPPPTPLTVPPQPPRSVVPGATSSPERPYVASHTNDVVENRPPPEQVPPIVLNPTHERRNPRFRPPGIVR
jgi:hypothetical protein